MVSDEKTCPKKLSWLKMLEQKIRNKQLVSLGINMS